MKRREVSVLAAIATVIVFALYMLNGFGALTLAHPVGWEGAGFVLLSLCLLF